MARPFTTFPAGAKDHLEAMASHGLLSESKAATALGMPFDQFKRVIAEDKASKTIWENALSIEKDELLGKLWNLASGGDRQAATTLLAVRHGLTEKQPTGGGGGVTVNFTLPAALDADAYLKTVQSAQKALPEGAEDD